MPLGRRPVSGTLLSTTWPAAYAIKDVQADRPNDPRARVAERDWQRSQVPEHLLPLVIEDQERRNDICWGVFED